MSITIKELENSWTFHMISIYIYLCILQDNFLLHVVGKPIIRSSSAPDVISSQSEAAEIFFFASRGGETPWSFSANDWETTRLHLVFHATQIRKAHWMSCIHMYTSKLVGGAMCPSWKMMEFVNGKDDIPYIVENKSCSKPPTSKLWIWQFQKWERSPWPRGGPQTWTGLAEKMKRCCFRRTLTVGCGPPGSKTWA
jgi:hypothetical protein